MLGYWPYATYKKTFFLDTHTHTHEKNHKINTRKKNNKHFFRQRKRWPHWFWFLSFCWCFLWRWQTMAMKTCCAGGIFTLAFVFSLLSTVSFLMVFSALPLFHFFFLSFSPLLCFPFSFFLHLEFFFCSFPFLFFFPFFSSPSKGGLYSLKRSSV